MPTNGKGSSLLCIILIVLLSGCSTFTTKPYRERITESTTVTWLTVDNVHETCIMMGNKNPGSFQTLKGCARYDEKSCKIITGKTTTMEILGHELRHCFEGKFHEQE
jgi:hypothetical protein